MDDLPGTQRATWTEAVPVASAARNGTMQRAATCGGGPASTSASGRSASNTRGAPRLTSRTAVLPLALSHAARSTGSLSVAYAAPTCGGSEQPVRRCLNAAALHARVTSLGLTVGATPSTSYGHAISVVAERRKQLTTRALGSSMAHVSFARKYTPTSLDRFERHPSITRGIDHTAVSARMNVLLTGDPGCGKTATLNAIATQLECPTLHIDDLSDNGVSVFRTEVKAFCNAAAWHARRLVAIDNIDSLSSQCQHIVRSLMDTFSDKVQFVTTATVPGRLVAGLQSRSVAFRLPTVDDAGLRNILTRVATAEGMHITDDAATFLTSTCAASARRLLACLEKLWVLDLPVTKALCSRVCTAVDVGDFVDITATLCRHTDIAPSLDALRTMTAKGYSAPDILDGYFRALPHIEHLNDSQRYVLVGIIAKYAALCHQHPRPDHHMVMCLREIFNVLQQ